MEQNSAAAAPSAAVPLQFTGKAGEYFKIWIVNLCLSVLTLGIYSAWAKVRRKRYFYGSTLLAGSALADGLRREYTLNEIAIITRAGPARLLGLRQKGHLGPGADADVTVYARDADIAQMFATPRYVIKGGTLVVEEGQLRRAPAGRRLRLQPDYDAALLPDLRRHFEAYSTVSFENYPVQGLADEPIPIA